MKQVIRLSFILTIITAMIHIPMFAQTYDNLWKQVKEAEEKSLPKTVMELSDKIFRKAQREQNAPQMFKAYLYKTQSQEEVTPDSIYPNFKYVEKWVREERITVNRAILHSMLAGMYQDYLGRHSYELRNRTELAEGEVPEDMREWTRGLFEKQIEQHANAALDDVPTLLKTSAKDYVPFAVLGNGSEFYAHDMYHLMATRTIENLQELRNQRNRIEQIYQQMMQTYAGMKDREEATLMVTLDYWRWKDANNHEIYDELINKYAAFPAVLEAYLGKAQWLNANDRPAEAMELIDKALAKYPKYYRANALVELKAGILQPCLAANMLKMLYPGEDAELAIDFKNQRQVEVRLLSTKFTELPEDEKTDVKDILRLQLQQLQTWQFELKPEIQHADNPISIKNAEYLQHKNTFKIQAPEKPGVYLLCVMPKDAPEMVSCCYLVVSRFKVLILNLGDGDTEVVTLDRKTGQPIGGVEVTFYRGYGTHYKEYDKVTTNADGRKVFKSTNNSYTSYVARKGDDRAMLKQNVYLRNKPNEHEAETETRVTLLTDRGIYRPGQTVHVKGIVYNQKGEEANVVQGKTYHLTLHDVNGKELSAADVRTNDFGSFQSSFVLPAAALNGTFSIRTNNGEGYKAIKVEEYKRPTFEIAFEPVKEAYRLGDKIELKGHVESFSGATVQNVPLSYRIVGNIWRIWNSTEDPQAADTVMIDNKGDFVIPIELKANDSQHSLNISVEATVTNEAGETQTASRSIWASQQAYSISIDIPGYLNKTKTEGWSFTPVVNNAAGQPQDVTLHYRLYRLEKENVPYTEVKQQKVVEEGDVKSNENHIFSLFAALPSAQYMLELTVVGEESLTEEQQSLHWQTINLYSDDDTRFGTFVDIFLDKGQQTLTFDEQHPATFIFGTSHIDAYVLMDVFAGNKRVESKTLQLNNALQKFVLPYKEAYGEGVTLLFTFVKDDKVYARQLQIEKTKPVKQLNMKWEVFRDKLQPGQHEEWKLVIKTPDGAPATAELLAYMYDASLDKIYRHYQDLYVYYSRYFYSVGRHQSTNNQSYWSFRWKDKEYRVPVWEWDYLDIPRMRFYRDDLVMYSRAAMGATRMMKSVNAVGMEADMAVAEEEAFAAPQMANAQATADSMEGAMADEQERKSLSPADESSGNESAVRTNFAETAFFYPQLRTNEQGEIVLSFTMPESLTRWNFRGISHTKDMMVGNLSAQAVTQKDFMLRPNMPRFVRMGDKMNITAIVSNLTDNQIKGTATFTLFDPITDKTIATQQHIFSTEGKGNTTVSFDFEVTEDYTLLGVRMVADGGKFSDGEQHVLPVLSNKQYITETLAMPIRGNQTREFSTAELFNHQHPSATQKKLTVEFTGNPAWYAVQTLPEISEPTSDNAIAWASAFYGNMLATYIANSQPRIQQVFNRWKLEGADKQTLLSQLEKNQELKEIILNETPWVMDAQNETERKQRLGLLFDINQMNNRIDTDLTKLQGLQNEDGGWSWFSGMESSYFTTTYITGLLIRLDMLLKEGTENGRQPLMVNAQSNTVNEMKEKGFAFLHTKMLEHYQEMLRNYGKDKLPKYLSYMEMQYLYLIAIGDMTVPAKNNEAYNHFLSLVDNNLKDGDVIDKAQSAIIQHKTGKLKSAQNFINSLKEHMVDEDEMGAHFAFLDKPYTWAMIPVPQHVATMEALRFVGGDDDLIEEMKMWLLKQKQTRGWNSSICTVDAIYALLCRGANLLENKGDVRITFADRVMETISPTKSDTPDLGYIKEVFADKQTVEASVIKVEKRDDGIAWGAAYAQYFTPMTDIQQYGKELNLDRRFYVERIDAQGKKTLQQIGDGAKLKVGDVVVSRMTIELDRTMDFVQLKDRPAACFEPVAQLSGYRWNGVGYYMEVEDAATNYFFDMLGKGMHVLEVRYRVQRTGTYQVGASTVQSAYAPEFASHSSGITIVVDN